MTSNFTPLKILKYVLHNGRHHFIKHATFDTKLGMLFVTLPRLDATAGRLTRATGYGSQSLKRGLRPTRKHNENSWIGVPLQV